MTKVTCSKTIPEPDRVLEEIGKTRNVMLQASSKVRPFGPAYHALSMVTTSIDGLASFISGERHYFATRQGEPRKPDLSAENAGPGRESASDARGARALPHEGLTAMANVTYHVVLPIVRDDDTGELVAEAGQEAPSEHSVMSRAHAMIGRKASAIAFSRTSNPAIGDFDDAAILGRYGETPGEDVGKNLMLEGLAKPYAYRWLHPPPKPRWCGRQVMKIVPSSRNALPSALTSILRRAWLPYPTSAFVP